MFDSDSEEKTAAKGHDLNRNYEVKKPKTTKDNEPAANVLESNKTKSTITLRSVVPPAIPLIIKNNRLYSNRPLRPDASPNVKSLHSAATQGHAEEQFELGFRYESADGIETNNLEAAFWYLLAAKQGHIKARMRLAYFFEHGMGVWMNEKISKQLLADSKNDTISVPDYSKIAHLISQEQDFEARAKSLRS
jgi:TPR repeat protein